MNKSQGVSWESWIEEFKRVAKCSNFTNAGMNNTDWSAFRQSYDEDMTPAEAMLEDMSYA